ncbi:putative transmembrane protein [Trifolium repens]|nr:putative transmembrane protein [Trifolium repens]
MPTQLSPLPARMFPYQNYTCLLPSDTEMRSSLPQAEPCQRVADFPKHHFHVALVPPTIALQNSFRCLRSLLDQALHNLNSNSNQEKKKRIGW